MSNVRESRRTPCLKCDWGLGGLGNVGARSGIVLMSGLEGGIVAGVEGGVGWEMAHCPMRVLALA